MKTSTIHRTGGCCCAPPRLYTVSSAGKIFRSGSNNHEAANVVYVGVGGDIATVRGLPAYLESKGVKKGAVITLDTLGHGDAVYQTKDWTYRFLLSARSSDLDWVGRKQELDDANIQYEHEMPTPEFCGYFKDYLSRTAFVGLYHCFSGEDYKTPPTPGVDAPSIMKQVLLSLGMEKGACGVVGFVDFVQNHVPQPRRDSAFVFGQVTERH